MSDKFLEFLQEISALELPNLVHYYVLDRHHTVVAAQDILEWARFFEKRKKRIVKQETIGHYWVSTVFLGIDHGFGTGAPVLFETMVFLDKEDSCSDRESGGCERYCTWEEAAAGHEVVCARLRENG